ncbi:MAG: hypothetical protein QM795_16135 [Pseudoxanthomonas sp.]
MRYALRSAFLFVPMVAMAAPADIPPEVLARQTCQEHVLEAAKATAADFPKVSGEYNAYVIIDYRLDGSGSAVDPRVVEAKPRRGFDDYALRMLGTHPLRAGRAGAMHRGPYDQQGAPRQPVGPGGTAGRRIRRRNSG